MLYGNLKGTKIVTALEWIILTFQNTQEKNHSLSKLSYCIQDFADVDDLTYGNEKKDVQGYKIMNKYL